MGLIPPSHYSQHFSKYEMRRSSTATRLGIDNAPGPEHEKNLRRLCNLVLEPLRDRFGLIRITSGYRCEVLNTAIDGSRTSAHMDGRAADLVPGESDVTLRQAVDFLVSQMQTGRLPIDQVIYEFGEWVHVGIAKEGDQPRRQALMIFQGTGYLPFDRNDKRVR